MSAEVETQDWLEKKNKERKKKEEKSDALVAQELKDAHAWGEEKDDAELVKAIVTVLRNADLPWVSAFMKKHLTGPDGEVEDKHLRANLEAARMKLVDLHVQTVEKICETLREGSCRLPNNVYNIQQALDSLSWHLDPFDPTSIDTACSIFPSEIYPRHTSSGSPVFTSEDMDEEHQRGFEAGYQKALRVMQETDVDERFGHVDLSE